MTGRLTKRVIDDAEAREDQHFVWDTGDGAIKGFGLRISTAGRKTFVAQFRVGRGRDGKLKRVTIGAYGVWTVEQAAKRAKELIRAAESGVDLEASEKAKQEAKEAAQEAEAATVRLDAEMRLSALAKRFMEEHVALKRKATTQDFYQLVLDRHILPALGEKDVREITRQDVAKLHAGLADRPTMANRAVAVLGALYGWADRLEILPEGSRNPTQKVELFRENARERFLSVEELASLGEAIRLAETTGIPWNPRPEGKSKHAPREANRVIKIAPEAAAAIRLLLFTGARLREILHLQWSDVDAARGLLRLRDSKVGPVTIVLNAPARAVLAGIPKVSRYVIPGEATTDADGTRIDHPRADLKRPWLLITKAAGLEGLRIHDLRHSFASVGAGDGHGLTIVGRLLNHSQVRTMARYQHLGDDPLRRASDAIANRIAVAIGEAPEPESAEIVEIVEIVNRRRGGAG